MAPLTPWRVLAGWPARRWAVAVAAAVGTFLAVALPTALIDNPVFGRSVPPTWWAAPSLALSSVLAGLLVASYVRPAGAPALPDDDEGDEVGKGRGWLGAVLTYFAVGCPVCNKIVLLALGSAGAMTWFAPVQPFLQAAAVGLLVWALSTRLRGEVACAVPA